MSSEDSDTFKRALEQDTELKKEFIKQKNIWAVSTSVATPDEAQNTTDADRFIYRLSKVKSDMQITQHLKVRLHVYKIAAVLLFGLLMGSMGYLLLSNTENVQSEQVFYTDTYVPKGDKLELTLPDGTHIFVNADSKLRIPSNFSRENRHLWIEGEAYFNVTQDTDNPFLIVTPSINIEVLGTSFDLSCYANDEIVTTVLDEGSVRFSGANNVKINGALLKAGETARYHKETGIFRIVETKDEGYASAWKQGQLKFKDMPFYELARKIERLYDVEIEMDDELKFERYTGEINSETVWAVMNHFAIATPFNVTVNGRQIKVTAKRNFK